MKMGSASSLSEAESRVQHPDPDIDLDVVVLEQNDAEIPEEIQDLYEQSGNPIPSSEHWCYVLFSSQMLADTVSKQLQWKRCNPKRTERRLPILFAPMPEEDALKALQGVQE